MKTFDDLEFTPHSGVCGVNAQLFFNNGFGVAVIKGLYSVGGRNGLYEIIIMKGTCDEDSDPYYDTPLNTKELEALTPKEVTKTMLKIQSLNKLGQFGDIIDIYPTSKLNQN